MQGIGKGLMGKKYFFAFSLIAVLMGLLGHVFIWSERAKPSVLQSEWVALTPDFVRSN